jgi:hypothetical protein
MDSHDWSQGALCFNSGHRHYWTSYDYDETQYAKTICNDCKVKLPCLIAATSDPFFVGVSAGLSKYDMLMAAWRRIEDASESNWSGPDSVIEKALKRGG